MRQTDRNMQFYDRKSKKMRKGTLNPKEICVTS